MYSQHWIRDALEKEPAHYQYQIVYYTKTILAQKILLPTLKLATSVCEVILYTLYQLAALKAYD